MKKLTLLVLTVLIAIHSFANNARLELLITNKGASGMSLADMMKQMMERAR